MPGSTNWCWPAARWRGCSSPVGRCGSTSGDGYSSHHDQGAPKKSLLLGPQRLAVALLADGWVIRNQVVWAKVNPMPSSVGDRLSCTHEVLLLLVRSPRYFFDLDAIRQPITTRTGKRPAAAATSTCRMTLGPRPWTLTATSG